MNRPCNSSRLLLVLLGAISCAALLAAANTASARQQSQLSKIAAQPQAKLTVKVAAVRVDVSVADPHGKFLDNLQQQNFRVYDDGVEQPITFFASIDAPAQVLVLLETSPAVYLIHRQHLDAAYALLDGLGPGDQVALAIYSQQVSLMLSFTPDKAALDQALLGVQYGMGSGELNFYDAVAECLDWLTKTEGKKALVILSTGLDSSPAGNWDSLLNRVRGSEVTIFPVALGGSLRTFNGGPNSVTETEGGVTLAAPPGLSFQAADRALKTLAEMTGGQAFFPMHDKEFIGIYKRIADSLRHEYTIGFSPARDGKFHAIRIEILDGKGRKLAAEGPHERYRIFARQGYQAPEPGN